MGETERTTARKKKRPRRQKLHLLVSALQTALGFYMLVTGANLASEWFAGDSLLPLVTASLRLAAGALLLGMLFGTAKTKVVRYAASGVPVLWIPVVVLERIIIPQFYLADFDWSAWLSQVILEVVIIIVLLVIRLEKT
ncbi:MAG: hypothetical protein ACQEQU_04370 [Spirochaetota bacterium]